MDTAGIPARKEWNGPLRIIRISRESAGCLTAESLECLYDLHAPALYRYARSLTGSAEDAEDAMQEVFVRLARAGRRPEDPRSYLMKAVRNQCLVVIRSRSRRADAARRLADGLAPGRLAVPVDGRADIAEAVQALPLEQREVLILKAVEQMTFEEIASVTGVSANTAASRYRYAVARLRRELKESENE
ncbi:MAG: RNA polymerase sigma factor [Armatimonadota bacterium]